MAETNVELARRAARDLDLLIDTLAEDVVWDNAGPSEHSPPDHRGVFRGRSAVARIFREWVGAWRDYRIEVEEVIDAGDDVILVVTESGVGTVSAMPIHLRHCYRWRFRDGRIVAGSSYATKADALAAIGSST